MSDLTFEQLMALTTPRPCPHCPLEHAPVRTCDEAALEEDHR